ESLTDVFFQAEDGIRGFHVTGVQACALPSSGDAGDQYVGLDRFGRLVQTLWKTGATNRVKSRYGRDRLGNIVWRRDDQAHAESEIGRASCGEGEARSERSEAEGDQSAAQRAG